MTQPLTIAAALARIDKLQSELADADRTMVALITERAALRRQVEQLAGEISLLNARLAAKAIW